VETISAIVESCVRRGVIPGMQTRTISLARFWKERGMLFLGCNNETTMLYERASELIKQLSA